MASSSQALVKYQQELNLPTLYVVSVRQEGDRVVLARLCTVLSGAYLRPAAVLTSLSQGRVKLVASGMSTGCR